MSDTNKRLKVAIMALPGATVSTVYGMYDLFASAGRDWSLLVDGQAGDSNIEPYTVSTSGQRFLAGNGVWIEPDYALENAPAPQVICVPELLVDPSEDPRGCYVAETNWIKENYAAGSTLATACSGALLLAVEASSRSMVASVSEASQIAAAISTRRMITARQTSRGRNCRRKSTKEAAARREARRVSRTSLMVR